MFRSPPQTMELIVKMSTKLLLLITTLTIVSCRKLVQDEFPDFTPIPTINSILIADSLLKVHVSLAGKIDTNKLEVIDNAEVLIFIDGEIKDTLHYSDNGIYFSSINVEPLKIYTCNVIVPGYPKVSASDYIPEPPIIYDIVHINQAGQDREGQIYPALKFRFTNDPSQRIYYQVVLRMIKYGYEQIPELTEITDPVLLNEGIPISVFSNEIIEGRSYTITINYTTGSASSTGPNQPFIPNLYPLILEMRSISKNYYLFLKQQYLYERGRYPEFGSSFTSTSLYSNINGGYGIFAGYSSTQSDTIFPDNTVK
jgi:hypothetical protein